jgi:hypothetical protein
MPKLKPTGVADRMIRQIRAERARANTMACRICGHTTHFLDSSGKCTDKKGCLRRGPVLPGLD